MFKYASALVFVYKLTVIKIYGNDLLIRVQMQTYIHEISVSILTEARVVEKDVFLYLFSLS